MEIFLRLLVAFPSPMGAPKHRILTHFISRFTGFHLTDGASLEAKERKFSKEEEDVLKANKSVNGFNPFRLYGDIVCRPLFIAVKDFLMGSQPDFYETCDRELLDVASLFGRVRLHAAAGGPSTFQLTEPISILALWASLATGVQEHDIRRYIYHEFQQSNSESRKLYLRQIYLVVVVLLLQRRSTSWA